MHWNGSILLKYICNNIEPFKCRSGRRHFGLLLLWNLIMNLCQRFVLFPLG